MSAKDGRLRFEHDTVRSASELFEAGKAARGELPRSAHAAYTPPEHRDPVGILRKQHEHRVVELIPLRLERMTASPFAFYRGSAAIQAADLRDAPRTGVNVTICGDAHVSAKICTSGSIRSSSSAWLPSIPIFLI